MASGNLGTKIKFYWNWKGRYNFTYNTSALVLAFRYHFLIEIKTRNLIIWNYIALFHKVIFRMLMFDNYESFSLTGFKKKIFSLLTQLRIQNFQIFNSFWRENAIKIKFNLFTILEKCKTKYVIFTIVSRIII